jgi:hypothetical protein
MINTGIDRKRIDHFYSTNLFNSNKERKNDKTAENESENRSDRKI